MVGSQGDMICSISLRTGRMTWRPEGTVGDVKKAVSCVSELDASTIVAGMNDGGLTIWDAKDGLCHLRQRQEVGVGNVRFAVAVSPQKCCLVIKLPNADERSSSKKKKKYELVLWSLDEQRAICRQKLDERDIPVGLGYTNETLILASRVILEVRSVVTLETLRSNNKLRPIVTKLATCVSGTAATGHLDGSILIWSSEQLRKEGSVLGSGITRLHWHASSLLALCFGKISSVNEELLFSGADEGVLVVWRLGLEEAEEQRDFLPRLGAPIETLVAAELDSEQLVLAVTADCSIHCVAVGGASLCELWCLNGCCVRVVPPKPDKWTVRLVPTEYGRLLTNARPGWLDIFEPSRDEIVAMIDVVPHNRIRSAREIARQPVVLFAAARRGLLVTIDAWLPKGEKNPEIKFWTGSEYEPASRYVEAMVRAPHGENIQVTALAVHPDVVLAVSAGIDGSVRVWTRVKLAPRGDDFVFRWTCTAALTKDLQASVYGLVFSRDGSSLAVAKSGRCIDLVTPADLTPIETLRDDYSENAEHRLVTIFDQCEDSAAVLCDSDGFSLWALSNGVPGKAKWRYSAPVLAAAASVNSYHFALAISGTKQRPLAVFIFAHNEPAPTKAIDISTHFPPRDLAFLSNDTLVLLQPTHILQLSIKNGHDQIASVEDLRQTTVANTSKKRTRTFDIFVHDTPIPHKEPRSSDQARPVFFDLNPRPLWTIDMDYQPDIDAAFDAYLAAHLRPAEPI